MQVDSDPDRGFADQFQSIQYIQQRSSTESVCYQWTESLIINYVLQGDSVSADGPDFCCVCSLVAMATGS